MIERILIAGSGGQGVMVLGKVMATAAMQENKFVTYLPSYGAEVRGGTAHCMVIISDQPVGSPYVSTADTVIALNEPSLVRFSGRLDKNGLLLVNSSLVNVKKDANLKAFPFTEMALKLGNIRVANIIALGAYISAKKILKESTILKVIEEMAPKKELIRINQEALREGLKLE